MELTPVQQKAKRRQELQTQIAAVDRQMSLELEEKIGRVPTLKPVNTDFPWANWITTAVVFGWVFFGDMADVTLHGDTVRWALLVGIFFLVVAVLTTLNRILNRFRRRTSRVPINEEETEALQQLRARKAALQKELEELK